MPPLSVIIQAGGKSSRMGQDKALVPFRGVTMLEYILQQVSGLGSELALITNSPEDYRRFDLPLYGDLVPDWGALGGLYTALRSSAAETCLLLACDMPFVNLTLVRHLIGLSSAHDAVIPRLHPEYAEPFRAVYRKTCIPAIEAAIAGGQRRVISFFDQVDIRFVERAEVERFDPGARTFFNVNTPEDLLEAERMARWWEASAGRADRPES